MFAACVSWKKKTPASNALLLNAILKSDAMQEVIKGNF